MNIPDNISMVVVINNMQHMSSSACYKSIKQASLPCHSAVVENFRINLSCGMN